MWRVLDRCLLCLRDCSCLSPALLPAVLADQHSVFFLEGLEKRLKGKLGEFGFVAINPGAQPATRARPCRATSGRLRQAQGAVVRIHHRAPMGPLTGQGRQMARGHQTRSGAQDTHVLLSGLSSQSLNYRIRIRRKQLESLV